MIKLNKFILLFITKNITSIFSTFAINHDNKSTIIYRKNPLYYSNFYNIYNQNIITPPPPNHIKTIYIKCLHFFYLMFFVLIYNSILLYGCKKIKIRINNNINNLTIVVKYNNNLDVCSICYNDYTYFDDIRKLKNCTHIYHEKCIKTWIIDYNKLTCPMCKTNII